MIDSFSRNSKSNEQKIVKTVNIYSTSNPKNINRSIL